MLTNRHRKSTAMPGPARPAVLTALLAAAAGLASLAAAGEAQAVHGVATAVDDARALANPGHPSRFDDSFTVHQEGAVYAASLHNEATAESAYCRPSSPCRSISLSFQIVTMAGTDIHLNASNLSHAANVHCDGCQTLAGAYQFIVSTPRPFVLSASDERALADVHRRLDALGRSTAPISEIQQQADNLAAQVAMLLRAAAATAPKGPGVDALSQHQPQVTVHRIFGRS